MKKSLYVILLIAELIVDFLLISQVWNNVGWIPCEITIVVWAVLLVCQIVKLKKNGDAVTARKIKRNIALIMLIPLVLYVGMILWLIIVLFGAI